MKANRGGVEARIERVEHRAAHRHAVVALEHGGRIGEHDRDGVAAHEPALRQHRSELLRAHMEVPVAALEPPMGDRRPVRKDLRGALQEGERRQRLEVGGIAIEIAVIGRERHGAPPGGSPPS
jgi:hypothetical protein